MREGKVTVMALVPSFFRKRSLWMASHQTDSNIQENITQTFKTPTKDQSNSATDSAKTTPNGVDPSSNDHGLVEEPETKAPETVIGSHGSHVREKKYFVFGPSTRNTEHTQYYQQLTYHDKNSSDLTLTVGKLFQCSPFLKYFSY
jgi:hypothetical protein